MAKGAPKGNAFWAMRTKHGVDKLFKEPDTLWQACVEYFEATDARTLNSEEIGTGSRNYTKTIKKRVPYTLMGLCIFLDVNTGYFRDFKKNIEGKTDKLSKGFSVVITRVEEIIFHQQYEGATIGDFNHNIVARALGLVDKKDITTDGKSINKAADLSQYTDAELRVLAKLQRKGGISEA